MVSGNSATEIRNDPENGEWLSRSEFMARTGVSERTLTNRISKGYYKSRLNMDGGREVFLRHKQEAESAPETFQNAAGNSTEAVTGKTSGSKTPDPESNFRQDRKVSILDPEFSRSGSCEECDRMKGRVQFLEEQLKAVEIAYAKLEGQMDGKDALLAERDRVVDTLNKTVEAKDQAVNATQAAYLKLQDQFHQLEQKALPALETSASGTSGNDMPEARKTLWTFWKR